MNVTVARKELVRILDLVQGASDRKSTIPALQNILLAASGGILRASATDLYVGASAEARCDGLFGGDGDGSIALPAADIVAKAKAMPEGPISLRVEANGHAVLKSSASARKFTVPGICGDDYPKLPERPKDAPEIDLKVEVLDRLLRRVTYAMSTDVSQPRTNGIMLEWDGTIVRAVATDGHRLSLAEEAVSAKSTGAMILPFKAAAELARLAGQAKGETTRIAISGTTWAFFNLAGVELSAKLAAEPSTFVPWRMVIQERSQEMRLTRESLLDSLRAIALASDGKVPGVKIKTQNGKLLISSDSVEHGSGEDELAAIYEGAEIQLGLNSSYALHTLGCLDADEVLIQFGKPLDPICIREAGNEDGFAGILMPMRL